MPTKINIADTIAEEMAEGRLPIPTLPEVALAISNIMRNDPNAVHVAQVIAKDPATTARLLAAANCVGIRGAGKVADNLIVAIPRLGFHLTRVLVNRIAMEQMFYARSSVLNKITKKIWSNSLEISALCHVLAKNFTKLNGETAMMVGLVHMVGALPIIRMLDFRQMGESDVPRIEETIAKHQAVVGQLVLKKWQFPKDLIAIPAIAGDYSRVHDGPADYGDVLNVAIAQLNHKNETLDSSQIPAFAKLGIDTSTTLWGMPDIRGAYIQDLEMLVA